MSWRHYQGDDVTVTTAYIEFEGRRFVISELRGVERVEAGGSLRSRRFELWAWYRGRRVRVFYSRDEREFARVARALSRAREYSGLPRSGPSPRRRPTR